MALISCPDCKRTVLSTTRNCPGCGHRFGLLKDVLLGASLMSVLFGAIIVSITRPTTTAELDTPQQIASLPVSNAHAITMPSADLEPADLTGIPALYRQDVAPMLNLLRKSNDDCKTALRAENVGMAHEQTNPANPLFFAKCGTAENTSILRFTWMEAVNEAVF